MRRIINKNKKNTILTAITAILAIIAANILPAVAQPQSISPTAEVQPECYTCQYCTDWKPECVQDCLSTYPCPECDNCFFAIYVVTPLTVGAIYVLYKSGQIPVIIQIVGRAANCIYFAIKNDCPQCADCIAERADCLKNCCLSWDWGYVCTTY